MPFKSSHLVCVGVLLRMRLCTRCAFFCKLSHLFRLVTNFAFPFLLIRPGKVSKSALIKPKQPRKNATECKPPHPADLDVIHHAPKP
jgi:hypothetical protein